MFGIDMGPSAGENTSFGNVASASGFATNEGEGDISSSDQFMKAILSGDATKTSQALAPQIGAAKTSAQQDIASRTQMGSRSGGTAAGNVASTDKVHSDITSLIGNLTGGAASSLSSTGKGLLDTGIAGNQDAFGDAKTIQAQKASQINDIFSSSAGVAAGIFGAIPGGPGSFGDISSNIAGSVS